MILNLNGNKWLRLVVFVSLLTLFFVAWAWIAGAIFMGINDFNIKDSTPITIYQYWYYYGENKKIQVWLIGSLIGGLIIIALPFVAAFTPRKKRMFGDARWASEKEIKDAGLYSDDGIIVGVKKGFLGFFRRYLVFGGSQHVLMAAPTRSGKGVGVVIPNLLTWKDSVVVLDIKQENWNITSGFRSQHGQECFLLNLAPRDYKSHRWNPLFYISKDPNFRVNDIQKIGQMLFPKIENEAPIWQSSARSLWLGMVLYLIETDELPVTMGEVLRQLTMGDERLAKILEKRQKSKFPLSIECYLALKEYFDTPDKTRGSVRKGVTSALELFYNPVIDAATAHNDFDLRELRKKRMSIYIGITPDDLDRLAPLINLFFQQTIDLNTREMPEQNPALKFKCLLLMDEFTSMGKVGVLSKGIVYIAGYGLRMLPIIQSPAQLRDIYGAATAETFIDNHALQIVFAPKNIKVAKEISETLGTQTVKSMSKTKQLIGKSSRSVNVSESSRALLMPQEVMQIGESSTIILLENTPPIRCHKIIWYKDPIFNLRGNGRDGVKWRSPKVPVIDPANRPTGEVSFCSNKVTQVEKTIVERPVTPVDIENIDNLNLEAFSCDFSKIEIPKGKMTDEAVDDMVDKFFTVVDDA